MTLREDIKKIEYGKNCLERKCELDKNECPECRNVNIEFAIRLWIEERCKSMPVINLSHLSSTHDILLAERESSKQRETCIAHIRDILK
jgi:hypothetical protein